MRRDATGKAPGSAQDVLTYDASHACDLIAASTVG